MSFSDTFSEWTEPLRNLQTSATKGKETLFGYLKGIRLYYDTPTVRVLTYLSNNLNTMTSHDSERR